MRGLWTELTDLLLPADCAGCGLPRAPGRLCAECRDTLTQAPQRVRTAAEGLPAVWAAAGYRDEVRAVLLAHKERGALALAGPLGAALACAVRAALPAVPPPVLLVPVPSARRAVAARGHDPVRRLARAAARVLREAGVPARTGPVLRQCRPVADQAGLGAGERAVNLEGALEPAPGAARAVTGAAAVLVDDVLTTGATLREAARAVRCAAARPVAAAVVACRAFR